MEQGSKDFKMAFSVMAAIVAVALILTLLS